METVLVTQQKTAFCKTQSFKLLIMTAFVAFIIASPIFASSDGIDGLNTWADKVKELLGANWVKAVCMIALCIEAIMIVVAGSKGAGGGALLQRFGPWVVGTLVLWSASSITNYFIGDINFN